MIIRLLVTLFFLPFTLSVQAVVGRGTNQVPHRVSIRNITQKHQPVPVTHNYTLSRHGKRSQRKRQATTSLSPSASSHGATQTPAVKKGLKKKQHHHLHTSLQAPQKTTLFAYQKPPRSSKNSTTTQKSPVAHCRDTERTVINKLLRQLGKPYHWAGVSPYTGFDCSGLIYYAYQGLLTIKIPRTANDMYHLSNATVVKKSDLQQGDWVFFHIHSHHHADHVGVYLGNGKFIQSPRTGKEIQISYLNEVYWRGHYLGARRVIMPSTIR